MKQRLAKKPFQRAHTRKEQSHLHRSGLTDDQQERVLARLTECLGTVRRHYGIALDNLRVAFDLSGTSAGQYRFEGFSAGRGMHRLRFNPYLLVRHLDESLISTIPHEAAHFAVAVLFAHRHPRPHGREWQEVMRVLGARPRVSHSYPVDTLPVRQQQRWRYRCDCTEHQISTTRHNRMQRGALYLCRNCRGPLILIGVVD